MRGVTVFALVVAVPLPAVASGGGGSPIAVTVNTAAALNSFSPQAALGAGVDGVPWHAVPEIYTPSNVAAMTASGLGAISYRLYTELSVQDWHWNTNGTFSEAGNQGYWTSSATPGAELVDTFGYRLPRRGDTHDQGNDDDYSRLDDGDLSTFWKSDPYLTSAYTGDPDSAHPQWVLVDLGGKKTVNAIQISWAVPFAVQYQVQYWTGDDAIYDPSHGEWVTFPQGSVSNGAGGIVTLALGDAGRKVEYVRVSMSESSGTCVGDPGDARDCVGYAIDELGVGTINGQGVFADLMRHSPDHKQTVTYASSTDPWHTGANQVTDQEQPGLDIVFQSGVTQGIAATVPIPMLYSTPANAAAELRYLQAQGYSIARVEMGEEPDGEYVEPEDDAALYGQFADALHAVNPNLVLGGPVFQSNLSDVKTWPDANGETSWTKRWLAYLAAHDHLGDLGFFSFEHYPFSACGVKNLQQNLLREPALVQKIVGIWRGDGLPQGLPIYITETNYSQNETYAAQTAAGALWYADLVGTLLSTGGDGVFYYEYEPIPLSPAYPCSGWGTYGLLLGNKDYAAQAPLAQDFGAQVLTQAWLQPGSALHTLYGASVGNGAAAWVTAYPVQRPDGSWAVLLVNRDLGSPHDVTVSFGGNGTRYFSGAVAETSFGSAQYGWVVDGNKSHPSPDGPAATATLQGGAGTVYTLPAESITVLDGTIGQ
jgi:hypothetical protein